MTTLAIAGSIGSIAGFLFGLYNYVERKRFDRLVKDTIKSVLTNLNRIIERPRWVKQHFEKINAAAEQLPKNDLVIQIARHTHKGRGDAVAIEQAIPLIQEQLSVLLPSGKPKESQ